MLYSQVDACQLLTSLGDARVAILEAVRARQELRQAVCAKAPGYVRSRIMTSDIFTVGLMSDQTWSEVNTILAAGSFLMPAPPPKAKGAGKQKGKVVSKAKVTSKSSSYTKPQNTNQTSSSQEKFTKGKAGSSSFQGKGRGKVPFVKESQPDPNKSSSSKN